MLSFTKIKRFQKIFLILQAINVICVLMGTMVTLLVDLALLDHAENVSAVVTLIQMLLETVTRKFFKCHFELVLVDDD